MANNVMHHHFRLTALQTWHLKMLFWIVANSEWSFNYLLSVHYIHLSVQCKLCLHLGKPDGILNIPKSKLWPF